MSQKQYNRYCKPVLTSFTCVWAARFAILFGYWCTCDNATAPSETCLLDQSFWGL